MAQPVISVQLYSVNDALATGLDATLARLAEIGFESVEAFDFVRRPAELKGAFERHGMTARTGHAIFLSDEVSTPDGILSTVPARAETFAAARLLGLDVVIDPYVPANRWATRDDVEATAARLNEAAREAAEYGLAVGYHNHDHEFRASIDGVSAYEIFAELLDSDVRLELDLYWAAAAGADVPALLAKLGSRVVAVHVKDGPLRDGITSSDLPKDQTPAGRGDVPLAEWIPSVAALEYAVIEFDHFAGDIFDGLQQSFDWLSAHLGAEASA